MNIPAELKYTKEHEWVKVDGSVVVVGITDYAQGELGDIVFVELPSVGTEVKAMEPFGTIEAVKAVSDLFSPISGKIAEANPVLEDDPMVINRDPYGEGWMIKVEIGDPAELDGLLDSEAYEKLIG
ncbi:MAG: glycine cleavage system protein GcvH [Candidatus Zixiibacteriota bacterium]|nr:MAG: glycine cleavage system protein GcvH [candidate division Zixibacteria bacterium]